MPRLNLLPLLALATLSAVSIAQTTVSARPGTLNYTDGVAAINGSTLADGAKEGKTLAAGQTLTTSTGKVEMLLTPGIFLRVGPNSTLRMISPDLTHTEVRLEQGQADIEVDEIYHQNRILVDLPNGQVQLLKRGLYAFDASSATVSVFDGQASVYPGADLTADVKPIELKGGRRLMLNGEPLQPVKFDKNAAKDELYNWGSLRSQYLGEANAQLASQYADNANFYPGWYWAGGLYGYTWMPGAGMWWNPYGFYSPYYFGGGYYGGGFYGNRFYGNRPGFYGGRTGPSFIGGNGFHGGAVAGGGGVRGGGGGRR